MIRDRAAVAPTYAESWNSQGSWLSLSLPSSEEKRAGERLRGRDPDPLSIAPANDAPGLDNNNLYGSFSEM